MVLSAYMATPTKALVASLAVSASGFLAGIVALLKGRR